MDLHLGETIRALRKRNNRTQYDLAMALGISFQAVSRWESGSAYPDMELIPPIANYFGITIDELFGYECERDKIIDGIIERVNQTEYKSHGDDEWVEECIAVLREGLAQFPQNEKLLAALADVLFEAGWRCHDEWLHYDEEGYIQYSFDEKKKNRYWTESAAICESLADNAKDSSIVYSAVNMLVMLYRTFGETEKAISYAKRMPPLARSRELLLCSSCDGKLQAEFIGEALLEMADCLAEQTVYGLVNNEKHFESDFAIEKVKGLIAVFDLICDDGSYGEKSGAVINLYLYLSRLQWERGYHDEAFDSLDRAYECSAAYSALCDGEEHHYTSELVSNVSFTAESIPLHWAAQSLPESWPVWTNPDCSAVEEEITADPRWELWVKKCQG